MADLVSRNLSSATKAVVVAFTNDPDRMKMCEEERVSLAAALRTAADQVVPEKLESYGIRYELLRIADELEAQ
jgi:hypothetical protein